MTTPLVVVGDSLLDRDLDGTVERLCPDAPVPVVDDPRAHARPGGAALAASLAAGSGRMVTLITALAEDEAGEELLVLLRDAGVRVICMTLMGTTPEKIRIRTDGRTLIRLDRGSRHAAHSVPSESAMRALGAGTVLVSDYGRGITSDPLIRRELAHRAVLSTVVWDPHPRGDTPVSGCRLVTPNRQEAGLLASSALTETAQRARDLAAAWHAGSVAITMGGAGALLVSGRGTALMVPAPVVAVGDPCGAGDCFATTAACLLSDGATPSEAVAGAVASASAFVAAGGAAVASAGPPSATDASAEGMAATLRIADGVRARGGRVVATGGCFDLLHAGHIASLRAARSLGDCLVVCLNSDASVRRLKGAGRPLVNEVDRAEVLAALGCVDAVVIFDEPTPESVLRRLRPHIFAKGGDHQVADMPEADLVRTWGGEAVLVPYLEGRSTSAIVDEIRLRAG